MLWGKCNAHGTYTSMTSASHKGYGCMRRIIDFMSAVSCGMRVRIEAMSECD